MGYETMTIGEMAKLDGVVDLKTAAKVKFIKALQAEARGETADAESFLAEAIEAEANPLAGIKGAA